MLGKYFFKIQLSIQCRPCKTSRLMWRPWRRPRRRKNLRTFNSSEFSSKFSLFMFSNQGKLFEFPNIFCSIFKKLWMAFLTEIEANWAFLSASLKDYTLFTDSMNFNSNSTHKNLHNLIFFKFILEILKK